MFKKYAILKFKLLTQVTAKNATIYFEMARPTLKKNLSMFEIDMVSVDFVIICKIVYSEPKSNSSNGMIQVS